MRYKACEAFYNIAKVMRSGILQDMGAVFDGLCRWAKGKWAEWRRDCLCLRLYTDVEQNIKEGAQSLDRLVRDIVVEQRHFDYSASRGRVSWVPTFRVRLRPFGWFGSTETSPWGVGASEANSPHHLQDSRFESIRALAPSGWLDSVGFDGSALAGLALVNRFGLVSSSLDGSVNLAAIRRCDCVGSFIGWMTGWLSFGSLECLIWLRARGRCGNWSWAGSYCWTHCRRLGHVSSLGTRQVEA